MNRTIKYILCIVACVTLFSACEKDIDIKLPAADSEIVVEAYINQRNHFFNYVILTRSVDYFNPGIDVLGVSGASVDITEGSVNGTDTVWDIGSKKHLFEILPDSVPGFYFQPLVKGRAGYIYKLEIVVEGKYIWGVTSIPQPVPLDSLTWHTEVNPKNNKDTGRFMTIHFMEPVHKGDCYRAMYKIRPDTSYFGWGSISDGDALFNDDDINGVYRHFTYGRNFRYGDTINYYFNTIDRQAYNFWDSYNQAKNNGGPFATPVQLKSTMHGAIGSFTGMAVSYRRLIIKNP